MQLLNNGVMQLLDNGVANMPLQNTLLMMLPPQNPNKRGSSGIFFSYSITSCTDSLFSKNPASFFSSLQMYLKK
jgi:hypothetical protein